ncbi:DUF2975 domain-containing protein [Albibacterium sp.]|uniref:DUF2975 domain-containing protein n=1 Tax=Albibacterium sp. TaxID=2952885 RepID=UPI002CAACD0A|nr:DUF2975 domain-containing protein [Albibacterium sp.]HUH18554.1 DUF2975 domain-containing protein [Albibacterium sp.]
MKTFGNRSLSSGMYGIINTIWWFEWLVGLGLITYLLTMAFMRKPLDIVLGITFSEGILEKVDTLIPNGNPATLKVTSGNFSFSPANLQEIMLVLTALLLSLTVVFLITYQLKKIFLNFKKNEPLNKLNFPRIKYIGVILIIANIAQWLYSLVLNQYLIQNFKWGNETQLTHSFNVNYFLIGIVLLIVSKIFEMGASLEEENSLTI